MKYEPVYEIIPLILWQIIVFIPLFFIVKRSGKSRWWSILAIIPPLVGFFVLLYILAFSRWPKENAPH